MNTWREIIAEALAHVIAGFLIAVLLAYVYRDALPSILEKLLP